MYTLWFVSDTTLRCKWHIIRHCVIFEWFWADVGKRCKKSYVWDHNLSSSNNNSSISVFTHPLRLIDLQAVNEVIILILILLITILSIIKKYLQYQFTVMSLWMIILWVCQLIAAVATRITQVKSTLVKQTTTTTRMSVLVVVIEICPITTHHALPPLHP